jgi:pimeloyl-ACP methyl ester carboxylesterase
VVSDFYPAFNQLDEYAALKTISKLPSLVLGGEDDLITPVDHTARIMEMMPNAEARRLKNCGHLGMIEHHEVFDQALDDLLTRVRDRLD